MDLVNQGMDSVRRQTGPPLSNFRVHTAKSLGGWFGDCVGLVWFGYLCFGLMGLTDLFFYWVAFELHVCIFDSFLSFLVCDFIYGCMRWMLGLVYFSFLKTC